MEGISKVAVEAVVNKVRSAIKEEAEQWQIVKRDLMFIVDEFEMMESFLGSADREAAVKTNMGRTWVRQARYLSHDLEDCIEFIRHLDTDKRRWWLRLRPSCSCSKEEAAALPVDKAVTKIKLLKARVEELSQRNKRYGAITITSDDSAGSKFPTPPPQEEVVPGPGGTGTRGFDILVEARHTAARYRSVGDLTKLVMGGSNDIQVISVWGSTGDDFGTTSIIRSMYDEPEVHKRFRSRAWVKVMHPINIPELIRSLVVQFYANSCQQDQQDEDAALWWLLYRRLKKGRDALSWTETSAGDLVKELVRKINEAQPYLIVLEDLSAMDQWDSIRPYLMRVPGEKKGSRIVVSTRHREIASLCTGKPYRVSELRRLSASQSICVFFNTGATNVTGIVSIEEIEKMWKNSRLVGRDAEFKKVFNLVKRRGPHNGKPRVICVWGLPGSGRTAVVTNVCYRMQDFQYMRILRMYQPDNLMGFCRCLLSDIPSRLLEGETPIQRCQYFLRNFRCLVVIDEVKSREEWKMIEDAQLISATSESCIVIVTTEESVAVHCAGAEDLVCSIKCLQQKAAVDLFQQAYYDEYQKIRNKPKKEAIQDKGNGNFFEQACEYIFDWGKLAFPNNANSFEGETFQNNRNSFQGEAFQNNANLIDGQAFQNNVESLEGHEFQNNGNSLPGQAFQSSSIHLLEGESSQNNGNSLPGQAFQNSSIHLLNGESSSSQNNGNQKEFEPLFEANRQDEYGFQNNGSLNEVHASENSEIYDEQAYDNGVNSFEEESVQHSGNLIEELKNQKNGMLLEEPEKEDSLEERTSQKRSQYVPLACINEAYYDECQKIRNKPKKEAIQDKGNGNFFEQACEYIFDWGELAFPNNANSFEGETFQNNGNSFQGEAFQNNANLIDGQAFQNNVESLEGHAFQNNGNSFPGQAFQNSSIHLLEGESSQNNGNSLPGQAFQSSSIHLLDGESSQNNGNSLPGQAFQSSSIHLLEGESSQNNGNSLPGQAFQNSSIHLFEGESSQNNGNSLPGQAFQSSSIHLLEGESSQNNGNSLPGQAFQNSSIHLLNGESSSSQNNGNQKEFEPLFEANRQDEYGFQNNGSLNEVHTSENSEIYDEQAYDKGVNSFEEESVQHSGNLIEELKNQKNGMLLEEPEKEDSLEERTSQDNQDRMFLEDPNVKAILSKSGGFPQVIDALGRYLGRQHVPNNNIRATEWHCQRLITNFMQELQTNPQFYCLGGLLAWMRSHFSSCPPSLMRCMLYLRIFPQGQTFGRKRLVRRWISEGYTKNTESNSLSDEEYAGELFDKLASQSVIVMQQQEVRYEVNGFFHEYMISRPMEDKILSPLEVSVLDERHCRVTTQTQGVVQHLSVWSNWERKNRVVFESLDLSRLRSFTVFGPWKPFFVSDKMEVLRVLDLEGSTGVKYEDVDRIAKVLLRLKFLSLRGCKDITDLPDSLGGLSQLESLDIRGTSVDTLGPCITKLQKLQYVRARRQLDEDTTTTVERALQPQPPTETSSSATIAALAPAPPSSTSRPTGTTNLLLMSRLRKPEWMNRRQRRRPLLPGSRNGVGAVRLHGGIGKMTALHTLGVIDVSVASGRVILRELGKLSQLRKLGVSGVNRENVHDFCSAIACHKTHLESLSVWFNKDINRAGCLDAISSSPMKLHSLELYGHQDNKLPSWMKLRPVHQNPLSKLDLHMTTIPQDEIDHVLGDLPKLRILRISFEEFQDGHLQIRGGFKALQLLEISLNHGLQTVTFHSWAMNNLEVLKLCCSDNVDVHPSLRFSGKNCLNSLYQVMLSGYCQDAMKQQLRELPWPWEIPPVVTADSRSS